MGRVRGGVRAGVWSGGPYGGDIGFGAGSSSTGRSGVPPLRKVGELEPPMSQRIEKFRVSGCVGGVYLSLSPSPSLVVADVIGCGGGGCVDLGLGGGSYT